MKRLLAVSGLLILFACAEGCGTARRGEPFRGPLQLTPEERDGEAIFMRNCEKCHPGGEAGFGPALNNKPLPSAAIRLQVRNGVGAMPSFSKQQISDKGLDSLVQYLEAVRRNSAK